jgi:hypothetical protein
MPQMCLISSIFCLLQYHNDITTLNVIDFFLNSLKIYDFKFSIWLINQTQQWTIKCDNFLDICYWFWNFKNMAKHSVMQVNVEAPD